MCICFCQWFSCAILALISSPCSPRVTHSLQQEPNLQAVVAGVGDGLIYSEISDTVDSVASTPLGD